MHGEKNEWQEKLKEENKYLKQELKQLAEQKNLLINNIQFFSPI